MDKPLQATLLDAIGFLDEHEIPYATIGGIAASLRGETRVTADVDIVIGIDVERALKLLNHLGESCLQPLFSGVDEVVQKAFILPLRHAKTRVKVDLAIGLSGFELQVITRAQPIEIGGSRVSVATAEDMIVMKLFASRPRDLQDAESIAMVQAEQLDWEYCRDTAKQLGEAVGQDLTSQVEKLRACYGPPS